MIEIVIPNFGDISIYRDKILILFVKRSVDLKGKVTCEYYYENELFLQTVSYKAIFWKLKIDNLTQDFKIKEIRNNGFEFFKSEYEIRICFDSNKYHLALILIHYINNIKSI